ncbi:MAG TPA: InlB B-repeat-containing protein, partial [Acholeplasmataceae bacterium]|nr:InlB B-repeat-containing protein [Acholeplasmataceae bacterium]
MRSKILRVFIGLIVLIGLGSATIYSIDKLKKDSLLTLEETKEMLAIEYYEGDSASNVTNTITLPLNLNGVPIEWKTSDQSILSVDGNKTVITTTETNKSVILTAVMKLNGQTVFKSFELIINNQQCLISFEGYEHFNFFIEKNSSVVLPPEPEKEGYDFDHWSTEPDGEPVDLTDGIEGDTNLYPVFKANTDTPYKVQYYYENLLGVYVLEHTDELVGTTDAVVSAAPRLSEGYVKIEHLNSKEQGTISSNGSLVLKVYYSLQKYCLSFNLGIGAGNFPEVNLRHGSIIPKPSNMPTATGSHFVHWSLAANGDEYDFSGTITSDMVLFAVYSRNSYEVKFYNENTLFHTEYVYYGDNAPMPLQNPTKVGYNFISWNHDLQNITGNTIVFAEFEIRSYQIKFFDFNNELLHEETVNHFTSVTPPDAPEVEGYNFIKWDTPTDNISQNLIVRAVYEKKLYAVRFFVDGVQKGETQWIPYQEAATPPNSQLVTKPETQQYRFVFSGWDTPTLQITKDTDVNANFDEITKQYRYQFLDEDGTVLKDERQNYGSVITAPNINPTKQADAKYNYTFEKYIGFEEGQLLVDNITFTASYKSALNKFAVKFFVDGVQQGETQMVEYGSDALAPIVTKASTEALVFTFNKWDKAYTNVMGTLNVNALFTSSPRKYTVTFNDDQGDFIESADWNYGEIPSTETIPYKEGGVGYSYIFTGWTPEFTAVEGNQVYKAKFTKVIGEYLVGFYRDETLQSKIVEISVEHGDEAIYPYANPKKAQTPQYRYEFTGWSLPLTNVTGDIKVYPVFNEIERQYTYSIISEYSENPLASGSVLYNGLIPEEPQTPQCASSHHFVEWRLNGQKFTFDMPITEDVVIEANFAINVYEIEFVNYNGTPLYQGNFEHGDTPIYLGPTPSRASTVQYRYEFLGWDSAIVPATGATTYTATYSEITRIYTVIWRNYDNTILETDVGVPYGNMASYDAATPTQKATKEFTYTFTNWDPLVSEVEGDVTYTAQFSSTRNEYTIRFNTDGGNTITPITKPNGDPVVAPADPIKTGYTFAGWDQAIPTIMPTEDVMITASWTINQYTITFDTDGGNVINPITQDYNTSVVAPANPSKEGYTFANWDQAIPETMPAGSITITALWTINQYTLTFDTDGGNSIDPITQDYNTDVTAPENPIKTGYTFVGWNQTIPATMPSSHKTIKALWMINKYTITFDTDGGNSIDPITQDYNTDVTAPENPIKTGYTFAGWNQAVPAKMPAGSITITALWTINQYTITFNTDGGSVINPITQNYNTNVTAPADPIKTGYTFT